MKAVRLLGPFEVEVAEISEPEIREPTDAIVEVTLAAVCGTDLHAYRGEVEGVTAGTVLGHEFVGVVAEVGGAVEKLRPGERVVASDLVACGHCWWCARSWHYQCPDASLFGYGTVVGEDLPGGQAERVRVPRADLVLGPIDPRVSDLAAVFAADVLPTAFMAVERARAAGAESIAVVGCGPVGLCAALCALEDGAAPVIAIDPDPRRRRRATELGAVAAGEDPLEEVRSLTAGRGADAVIEAVGNEAALGSAIDLVRARGLVLAVGAHHSETMPVAPADAFARELTVGFVVGDPMRVRIELMGLLAAGRLDPAALISHRFPLGRAADAYRAFDRREATKVALLPGSVTPADGT